MRLVDAAAELGDAPLPLLLPLVLMLQAAYVRRQDALQQSELLVGQRSTLIPLQQLPDKLLLAIVQLLHVLMEDRRVHRAALLIQRRAERVSSTFSFALPPV